MEKYSNQYKHFYAKEEWFSSIHDEFERNTLGNTTIYRDKILLKCKQHFGDRILKEEFFILDIGGGNGKRTKYIFDSVLRQPNKVKIDYNDISKFQLKKYKEVFPKNLNEIFIGNFDEINFNRKYDIILCMHTLYGIPNWNSENLNINSLVKIRKLLKPNGLACIIIRDKNNISYFIQNKFKDYIGIVGSNICAETIFQLLSKFNIKYDFDEAHSITPSDKLVKNDELSEISKNFISYYMHRKFSDIKDEIVNDIIEEIKRRKHNFEIDSSKIIWIYN